MEKGKPKLVGNMCNNCYVNYRLICIANRSVMISATLSLNHIDVQEIKRRNLRAMERLHIKVLETETKGDTM